MYLDLSLNHYYNFSGYCFVELVSLHPSVTILFGESWAYFLGFEQMPGPSKGTLYDIFPFFILLQSNENASFLSGTKV